MALSILPGAGIHLTFLPVMIVKPIIKNFKPSVPEVTWGWCRLVF